MIQKVISFGTTVVLARYLGPPVFGLFVFALVVVGSFELFKSMGIDAALIKKQGDFKKAANTAFIIIPSLGVILYAILNLLAPLIARQLNNNDLANIVRVLGIIFVISCFAKVPATILEKNMQFKKISLADFCGSICFSFAALIFVFLKLGIWSLVFAYIIKIFIYALMICIFAKWKPTFEFDKTIALELFYFGKFVFLTLIVWFLKMNLDNFLVGKLLGVTKLGLYAIAFNFANLSADYFGAYVFRATFPAFSKLQNNLFDLRSAFLKTLKYVGIVAFPFGVGVFFLGGDFLRFAYGEKWIGALNVLKILAWAGIFNTLSIPNSSIFLALGKPMISFWFCIIQVIIFFVFIAPVAKVLGINGVGVIVASASFIAMIFSFFWVMRLLSLSLKQVYLNLKVSFICSSLMAIGIIFYKVTIPVFGNIAAKYNFVLLFCFATVVYGFSLLKLERPFFEEIRDLIF